MSTLSRVLRAIEPHPGEHFKDKIIAVSLAFLVWFAVNSEQSTLYDFQDVPVRLVNLPDNLALAADFQDTLAIRVSAVQRDLERLRSAPGLLSPEIDLSDARAGENIFPIDDREMNVPAGVSIVSVEPPQVSIVLEQREEKLVAVSPVISGEPVAGFEVAGRSTDPEAVMVSGPRSVIDALERVETAVVNVSNRSETFTETVPLSIGNRLVQLPQRRTVQLHVDIAEKPINEQFDGVEVVVINNRYRVAVNPQQLGVVLSGPPSVLNRLDATQIQLVIDAAELEPSPDDYRIEPTVRFSDPEIGDTVQVVALYNQRVVNVHVYQQLARQ
ncbi:MAG: CdaR family protein [Acidobacteriota bacterium]|jgi:YbbR domain-containing protein